MSELGSIALDAVARRRGRTAEVVVTAEIPPGTHIESHRPPEPSLIPTVVEVDGLADAVVDYPEPVRKDLGISDVALQVYEGTVRFAIQGKAEPGVDVVRGVVSYQPCVGGACLPPRSASWEAALRSGPKDQVEGETPESQSKH